MIDGLGGEEVNQTTNVQTSYIESTGSLIGVRISNSDGALFPSITGSPASYGAFVQAGNVSTSAGSIATIVFGAPYTTTTFYVAVTPGSNALANAAGSAVPILSAVTVSGANFRGAASTSYNWIAVGL